MMAGNGPAGPAPASTAPGGVPPGGSGERRADARSRGFNGIDLITVGPDQRTLSVLLFGKAPHGLTAANFRLDNLDKGRAVTVTGVQVMADADPDMPDCLELTVDRPGDYSQYRLGIVTDGPSGPGSQPYPGFDACFYAANFSFKQGCASPGDCTPARCQQPSERPPAPVIDYLARDYASLRQALLDRLSLTMPGWAERHLPDAGMALVELLAYAGDLINYRLDAVGTEAYLDTARLRTSVRRHARLVDYHMHDGCAARAYVCLTVSGQLTLPEGDFRFATADGSVIFEPVIAQDVPLYEEHNEIAIWTWGAAAYCLPAGATSATLAGGGLHLAAGDLLVFEEVIGAVTGLPADADPVHRQVVRLTAVTPGTDALYDQPILTVTWDRADALGFPLCVANTGGPDCAPQVVAAARGNVVLVEHGASTDWCGGAIEWPDWPGAQPTAQGCLPAGAWGCPADGTVPVPGYPPVPFHPYATVARSPVTQHAPYPEPRQVAAGQAAALAAIPGAAQEKIAAMISSGTALSDADISYLQGLFGPAVVAAYGLATASGARPAGDPGTALRLLMNRFDLLLEGKLARLARLAREARAGRELTLASEGTELDWAWGAGTGQLIDPDQPVFRGPAAAALRPEPRAALPAITASVYPAPATPPSSPIGDPWLPRRDLLGSGPADRYFVGETDDDQVLTLRFGDGRAGLGPPPGAALGLRYRVGNGTAGNVGAEAITAVAFCATHQDVITAVRNPLPATGGTDPEPVAVVRQRAPRTFGEVLRRAITAADYAQVAGRAPGVQRAGAQLRWTGSWYEAQVAIDALGTEVAPGWLLDDESRLLRGYRRIGHDVHVVTGTLVPVELALCVQVLPGYVAGDVGSAVLAALGSGTVPDGTLEMFNPDNLTFGTPIRVSAIVAAVAAVPGVLGVAVTTLKRQFAPDEGAVAAGELTFAPDEIPQLDNDPAHPDHGVLSLTIGGGR